MELIPKNLLVNIPDLYETEGVKDSICHIRLFTPDANWSWYIIEISKSNPKTCYGYVQGLESELGYFSLEELELLRGSLGLAVERDLLFGAVELSKIKKDENM